MKNILPKIVVTLSAIILWLLIVTSQNYIGVVELPLNVYEPREEMTLGDVLPKTVKVRVEGPGRSLYFQRWSQKSFMILDVGTISGTDKISLKNYFEERPNQVTLPAEMHFLEVVYPDSIDIWIDNKIEKIVPVKIQSNIKVRAGFIQISEPETQKITLTGPQNYLEGIYEVRSEVFTKENVDISFQTDIPIINPNPDLVSMSKEKLDVVFDIEMIGERSIANIPITIKNKPEDLEIRFIPNTITLRVTGGNNQIQKLTHYDFGVYFDYLTQWFPNKNFYTVKISPPEEVLDVIKLIPEKVEVVVTRKNEE
jgi:YbbR domain-containing protein